MESVLSGNVEGFTREYFLEQVRELRERWGYRDFWQDPENASRAAKALGYVYLRTDGLLDDDAIIFEATIMELSRRAALVPFCQTERERE